jgi:tetratricopeptide (TPR) repeat protein
MSDTLHPLSKGSFVMQTFPLSQHKLYHIVLLILFSFVPVFALGADVGQGKSKDAENLILRANGYSKSGNTTKALTDYTAVIEMEAVPAEWKARALFDRGLTYDQVGNTAKALADYTAVIEMQDAPAEEKAKALLNRGVAYVQAGDTAKKMADYTAVIEMKDAPAQQKAKALLNRGMAYVQAGDTAKALADYTVVIEMKDIPAQQKAIALLNRGMAYVQAGDTVKALADYTAVIEMKGALAEQKAIALYNRGVAYGKAGNTTRETEDYMAVIAMKRKAMTKEGAVESWYEEAEAAYQQKNYQEALRLYSKIIELDKNHVNAYGMRGMIYFLDNQHQKAIDDFSQAIKLKPEAAYYDTRGQAYYALGKLADASRDALKACELGECGLRDQMNKDGKLAQ